MLCVNYSEKLYLTGLSTILPKNKKTGGPNGLWGGAILNRLFTNFFPCSHHSSHLHSLIFQSSWILLSIHLHILGEQKHSLV